VGSHSVRRHLPICEDGEEVINYVVGECPTIGYDAGRVWSKRMISGSSVPATRRASSAEYPPACCNVWAKTVMKRASSDGAAAR
jgi:hypothetical protein